MIAAFQKRHCRKEMRDENLEQSITRSLQDYFLLFFHSNVKLTLQATINFVEAIDTNCRGPI